MNYKILETHIIFKNDKLEEVAVLWVSNDKYGWVRATYCTAKPCGGYKYLHECGVEVLSDHLLQRVAAAGSNLPDNLKKKYFPGKRDYEE